MLKRIMSIALCVLMMCSIVVSASADEIVIAMLDCPTCGTQTQCQLIDAQQLVCGEKDAFEEYRCQECSTDFKIKEQHFDSHNWEEILDKREDATCTTVGSASYKCSQCGESKTEELKMLDHDCTLVGAVESTCETEGYTGDEVCNVCKETVSKGNVVDVLGHDVEIIPAVAPTCTETGLTEGQYCKTCGETLVAQEVVAAKGHSLAVKNAKKETCKEEGYTGDAYCSVCKIDLNDVYTDKYGIVIPSNPNSHTWNEGEIIKTATCTEKGTILYRCTTCGETKEESIDIDSDNHTDVVTDPAVDATCTEKGLTEGSHCNACQAVIVEQKEIPLAGHTLSGTPTVVDPTCTKAGSKTYVCSVCNSDVTEVIPALGHNRDVVVKAKAATCTEIGNREYTKCSHCGLAWSRNRARDYLKSAAGGSYTDGNITEALIQAVTDYSAWQENIDEYKTSKKSHAYGEGVVTIAPTCTEEGEKTFTCTTCPKGEEVTKTEVIPATGHTIEIINKVDATCLEAGYSGDEYCTVCESLIKTGEDVAALGHDYVNTLIESTCTEEGKAIQTCSRCDYEVVSKIAPTGHTLTHYDAVDPTCVDEGNYEYWQCETCQKIYKEESAENEFANNSQIIAALGHKTELRDDVAATCLEAGYSGDAWCTVCGICVEEGQVLEALGHNYETTVTPATCTEKGREEQKCSLCGDTIVKEIAKLGHEYAMLDTSVIPTCVSDGHKDYKCIRCDVTYTEYLPVDPENHSEVVVDEAVAPTCTETGLTEGSHCAVCDAVIVAQEEVDALGHTVVVVDEAVAPTCTETGLTEGSHCDVCGEVLVAQEEVKAVGHEWQLDPTKTVAPTTEKEGLEVYVCATCQEAFEKILPVVEQEHVSHTFVRVNTVPATCTQSGTYEYKCVDCDKTYTETIPATGHTVVVDKAVAPTCTETGLTEGSHCADCGEVLVAQEVVAAKGHNTILVGANNATYFAAGYTGDEVCSTCGTVISKGKTVAKLKLGKTSITVKAGKNKVSVSYKAVKGATGYQVAYKLKNGKWVYRNYLTKKAATRVIKKLQSNKKCYVKVRAFVASGSNKAYSKWTATKSVVIK